SETGRSQPAGPPIAGAVDWQTSYAVSRRLSALATVAPVLPSVVYDGYLDDSSHSTRLSPPVPASCREAFPPRPFQPCRECARYRRCSFLEWLYHKARRRPQYCLLAPG